MALARILIVEDDPSIVVFLQSVLRAADYDVGVCHNIADALARLAIQRPDLLILDLGLPDADGKTLIVALRQHSDIPIMVLSARNSEPEIVACLDVGADDYVVKPVGAATLLARVRVALRHALAMPQRDQIIRLGDLVIDLYKAQVWLSDQEVHLTPKEYALLALLAQAKGRVMTHRKLLAAVWGSEFVDHAHYLRVQMGNLRSKIERIPAEPRYLLTEVGVGYRLADS